ncbi:hypothetical protein TPHA_0D00310 [Tetrapisispora phaffii CBS 4417]|uniref:DNA-directed RNA polymerase n=1 Tax=Tetrapisispora phaffii (strain ATCC 24235 / CBS 4417 / NBRC 1672 / NRRL Y-8282 / UCD 70-5) TaxID=1071381 RepID=G8BS54_TETPH|nr:hypothetical protein TPHA_0D00310 [Tetrapisispora phaffii CBS 4417]CCE62675.1 hypothetical protein TPHA_0D00310 [Tetrapisispora phaffii CBS 4417]
MLTKRRWVLSSLKSRVLCFSKDRFISTKASLLLNQANNADVAKMNHINGNPNLNIRDLGFMKSSDVSLAPNFSQFDNSQSSVNLVSSHKRDVMQLWSLLEACLHSNYMERAFSILKSLYTVQHHRSYFIDDYNFYLMKFVENCGSISELQKKVKTDLQKHFPETEYNDKTLAIMIHHALSFKSSTGKSSDEGEIANAIKTYFLMGNNGLRKIVSFVDVFTVEDYNKLYSKYNAISLMDIPPVMRPLVKDESPVNNDLVNTIIGSQRDNTHNLASDGNETADDSSAVNMNADQEVIPKLDFDATVTTVDKDASKLVAVDTIGMKVVRHTLLGLTLNENQKKKIKSFHFEADKNLLNIDEQKTIDFYELSNSLTNEAERERFEDALNEFNQDRQRALELRATNAAKERWKYDFEEAKARGDISIKKNLNVKLWEWYTKMLPYVKQEIEKCKEVMNSTEKKSTVSRQNRLRMEYAPYFTLVDPEKMCVITILELLKLNSTGGIIEGMRTARAVIAVGKAIEMEFRSEQLLKNESHIFKEIKQSQNLKRFVRSAKSRFRSIKIEQSKIIWSQPARAKIGSIMISNLINVAKIEVGGMDPVTKEKVYGEVPAFSHSYQYHNGLKLGVLKIHKSLVHQLNGERMVAAVQPQLLPMLVAPREWKNWKCGGYYYTQSTLIRSKDSPEQVAYLKAVSDAGAIDRVYHGLNVLGSTPWTVNRKIFNVISEVWNTGKPFLDIPGIQNTLNLLPPPAKDADPSIIRQWKLKNKDIANKFSSNRSVRCDSNYKLEIARAFLGEKIYFPHNLDFRGRAYPLSPHFNHLGNDMSRGLLIFWRGKQLGASGLKWLKVHLSNLYGFDKASLEDRVRFAEENMENIKDSAENPLNGKGWWKSADKPWQALSTCIELNEAFKLENPEDFISHQPVHQDGTCNGLQHYAALGGDCEGAKQVNLKPSDKPMDVYKYVANLVVERLKKEAAGGDEKAKVLQDKITRKVVKQTVMTNVYGVTYVGATFQIDKQLSDVFENRNQSLELSKYLTRHVFMAIRELFHGAHLIQDWLGECSNKISRSIRLDVNEKSFKNQNKPDFMSSVIWTTPLGLPIVQPYREGSKKQVRTNLQTVFISDPFSINPVNARRQKAGFPPNFIHSLDASHMLLSASACGEKGLDFASVHDSYWTHACDIDIMNKALRDQFVALHEVDLIQRLKNEFDERYKNYVQVTNIDRSSDLAKRIIQVRAQLSEELGHSCTLADEIQHERTRQELLNSDNPEDKKKGEEMVTSVSLTSDHITAVKEVKASAYGSMPIIIPLKLPPIPPKGNFDVQETKESLYFFS